MSYAQIHGRQSSNTDYQENESETTHSLNIQMEQYYANDPHQQYLSPTCKNFHCYPQVLQFQEKEVQTSMENIEQQTPPQQEEACQVEIKQTDKKQKTKTPIKKRKYVTPKLKTPIKTNKKPVISTEEKELSELKDKPSISPYSKKLATEKYQRESQNENSLLYKHFNKLKTEQKKGQSQKKNSENTKEQSTNQLQENQDNEKSQNEIQENEEQGSQKTVKKCKYVPLHERYQIELEKKRQRMEEKQKKYEKENEVKKSKATSRKKTLHENSENDQRIKEKRKEQYLKYKLAEKQKEQEECTYRPKISKRSVEIVKKKYQEKGNLKLQDRLIEYEQERTVRLLQLLEDSQERRCFTPSPNSKKILEAKECLNKSVCPMDDNIPTYYIGDLQ